MPIPDTGSLASDLRAFAREVAENISSPGGSLRSRSIVAAAATSNELAAEAYGLWAERFVAASTMIDRAIERGELGASADADLIIEMLIGPLWVRLLLTGKPVTIDHADAAAAFVATALALD